MRIVSSKLGVTKTYVAVALAVIIAVGGIVVAYLAFRPSKSPMPGTHTVDWITMANYKTDLWNITVTNPYSVTLNDSMMVSSGDQWLTVTAYGTSPSIWSVVFMNNTYFEYRTTIPVVGGYQYDHGNLGCNDGLVYIVVNSTAITYVGITSHVSNATFTSLAQIRTLNGDGNFNGGELNIDVN
jgi:hypothetical protein